MRTHLLVLAVLLTLTFLAATMQITALIIPIFGLKLLLVAFYFMEMRHAHLFWRILLITFTLFFSILALIR